MEELLHRDVENPANWGISESAITFTPFLFYPETNSSQRKKILLTGSDEKLRIFFASSVYFQVRFWLGLWVILVESRTPCFAYVDIVPEYNWLEFHPV